MKQLERRSFLKNISVLGLVSLFGSRSFAWAKGPGPGIKNMEILKIHGKEDYSALYLKIIADDGTEGIYGPVDPDAALIADRLLKKVILGEDALGIGPIWDKMFGSSRHSRGSYFFTGMSAIDNALWDLRGKMFDQPVFRLLGGTRNKLRAYGSCLGYSIEPGEIQKKAAELKEQGYSHQKWFLNKQGPGTGPSGLQKDIESVRLLREALGEDADIMIDASRRWDLPYSMAWAKGVEEYHLRWLEEPLMSTDIRALAELSRYTSVPIAMGEHFYGRWDVDNYLSEGIIRVVQSDPEWTGGISEMTRICTLASVRGAHVIPHGHSMHAAMHLVASQPEKVCPLVEFLFRKMEGNYYTFDKNPPLAKNGYIEISERPGFGIELNSSKIKDIEVITWEKL